MISNSHDILDCLEVAIGVSRRTAELCRNLPRRQATAGQNVIATVDDADPRGSLAVLTGIALEHTPLLCVHAGVVSSPTGVVAIPGPSGLGKTTLTAALVLAGFSYLSDEVLALGRTSGVVHPFPRPLDLSRESREVLGAPGTGGVDGPLQPDTLGHVGVLGPARVSHILIPTRRSGPLTIEPASAADALAALLPRCFNHFRAPRESMSTLTGVARTATTWKVGYSSAPALATELFGRLTDKAEVTRRRRRRSST